MEDLRSPPARAHLFDEGPFDPVVGLPSARIGACAHANNQRNQHLFSTPVMPNVVRADCVPCKANS